MTAGGGRLDRGCAHRGLELPGFLRRPGGAVVSDRVIAIDGPAGSGKSTVARALAERLGWGFLDTGAMYRAVTVEALARGVDVADDDALADLAASLEITTRPRVSVNGRDVEDEIRTDAVNVAVSVGRVEPTGPRVDGVASAPVGRGRANRHGRRGARHHDRRLSRRLAQGLPDGVGRGARPAPRGRERRVGRAARHRGHHAQRRRRCARRATPCWWTRRVATSPTWWRRSSNA